VTVAKPISDGALEKMAAGLPMMGTRTRPAGIERVGARKSRIVLKEGKNRQIRRMVRKVGNRVVTLKRIRVAGISLGRLGKGRWRYLTDAELNRISVK
jgi:23S rRNA pseudouridine2605 synthase/23S rRNA pseudouridine2604 synthase